MDSEDEALGFIDPAFLVDESGNRGDLGAVNTTNTVATRNKPNSKQKPEPKSLKTKMTKETKPSQLRGPASKSRPSHLASDSTVASTNSSLQHEMRDIDLGIGASDDDTNDHIITRSPISSKPLSRLPQSPTIPSRPARKSIPTVVTDADVQKMENDEVPVIPAPTERKARGADSAVDASMSSAQSQSNTNENNTESRNNGSSSDVATKKPKSSATPVPNTPIASTSVSASTPASSIAKPRATGRTSGKAISVSTAASTSTANPIPVSDPDSAPTTASTPTSSSAPALGMDGVGAGQEGNAGIDWTNMVAPQLVVPPTSTNTSMNATNTATISSCSPASPSSSVEAPIPDNSIGKNKKTGKKPNPETSSLNPETGSGKGVGKLKNSRKASALKDPIALPVPGVAITDTTDTMNTNTPATATTTADTTTATTPSGRPADAVPEQTCGNGPDGSSTVQLASRRDEAQEKERETEREKARKVTQNKRENESKRQAEERQKQKLRETTMEEAKEKAQDKERQGDDSGAVSPVIARVRVRGQQAPETHKTLTPVPAPVSPAVTRAKPSLLLPKTVQAPPTPVPVSIDNNNVEISSHYDGNVDELLTRQTVLISQLREENEEILTLLETRTREADELAEAVHTLQSDLDAVYQQADVEVVKGNVKKMKEVQRELVRERAEKVRLEKQASLLQRRVEWCVCEHLDGDARVGDSVMTQITEGTLTIDTSKKKLLSSDTLELQQQLEAALRDADDARRKATQEQQRANRLQAQCQGLQREQQRIRSVLVREVGEREDVDALVADPSSTTWRSRSEQLAAMRSRAREHTAQISQLTKALQQAQAVIATMQGNGNGGGSGDGNGEGEVASSSSPHTNINATAVMATGAGVLVSPELEQRRREAVDRLQAQVKELEAAVSAKDAKVRAGRARISVLEQQCEDVRGKVKLLLAKTDADDSLITKLKTQVDALVKENNELRGGDAKKMAAEVTRLRNSLSTSTATITTQTTLLGRLQAEVHALRAAQMQYMDMVHQDWQAERAAATIADLTLQTSSLQARCLSLEERLVVLNEATLRASKEAAAAKTRLQVVEKRLNNRNISTDKDAETKLSLKTQLESAAAEKAVVVNAYADTLQRKEAALVALEEQLAQLRTTHARTVSSLEAKLKHLYSVVEAPDRGDSGGGRVAIGSGGHDVSSGGGDTGTGTSSSAGGVAEYTSADEASAPGNSSHSGNPEYTQASDRDTAGGDSTTCAAVISSRNPVASSRNAVGDSKMNVADSRDETPRRSSGIPTPSSSCPRYSQPHLGRGPNAHGASGPEYASGDGYSDGRGNREEEELVLPRIKSAQPREMSSARNDGRRGMNSGRTAIGSGKKPVTSQNRLGGAGIAKLL